MATVTACGAGSSPSALSGGAGSAGSGSASTTGAAPIASAGVAVAAAATPPTCSTASLSIRLGTASGAAGSSYQPLEFTNRGTSACTLYGYPGVAYVAPNTGHQVGAAASRNPAHSSSTVTLRPGATAQAIVQMADYANYGTSACRPSKVSGLRVYPPGNRTAAYVPFAGTGTACSSNVKQLWVESVSR